MGHTKRKTEEVDSRGHFDYDFSIASPVTLIITSPDLPDVYYEQYIYLTGECADGGDNATQTMWIVEDLK